MIHGTFAAHNASNSTSELSFTGTFGFVNATNSHVSRGPFLFFFFFRDTFLCRVSCFIFLSLLLKSVLSPPPGCYRDPVWPWYRQPFPWWTMFFLVPLYSTCSSLSNLQSFRSSRLPIMIIFSCCSYTANKASNWFLSDKGALAPAAGALVIGLLGNIYSRWSRGTAFTSMVTGVLFLVPVCVRKSVLPVSLALLGVLSEGELLITCTPCFSLALLKLVVLLETTTALCNSTTAVSHSACA
jgi:hypothetical protein